MKFRVESKREVNVRALLYAERWQNRSPQSEHRASASRRGKKRLEQLTFSCKQILELNLIQNFTNMKVFGRFQGLKIFGYL